MEDIIESKLTNCLLTRKSKILEKWTNLILDRYQSEGVRFFTDVNDPFRNPVGTKTKSGAEWILTEILGPMNESQLEERLSKIIMIRSIQELTAAEATSFLLMLKTVIEEELKLDEYSGIATSEVLEIFGRIDKAMLMAFDIYMANRERISQIKINEIKKKYTFMNMDKVPKGKLKED